MKVVMGPKSAGGTPPSTSRFGEGIDLRLLRCFVTVADTGSVTAAAQELYVSQPTLSRQLHRLEREIGLMLFRPSEGRLVMTPAGRELLPWVRRLLTYATDVRAFARDIACGAIETVHVATPMSPMHEVLAPFIATVGEGLPRLTLHLRDAANLYDSLDGDIDVALGAETPRADLGVTVLARVPVRVCLPAAHPLAAAAEVNLTELAEYPLLLPDRSQSVRRVLDVAAAADGLALREVGEFESSLVAMANAAAGRGLAVGCGDPAFNLVSITIMTRQGVLRTPLFAAWRNDHPACAALADLVSELSAYLIQRYGPESTPESEPADGSH
jgi:DNA-binding transcriptional LysR family regulator